MPSHDVAIAMGFAPEVRNRTGEAIPTSADHVEAPDLGGHTKAELVELAAKRGVEVASKWTKAEILEALEA